MDTNGHDIEAIHIHFVHFPVQIKRAYGNIIIELLHRLDVRVKDFLKNSLMQVDCLAVVI